MHMDEREVFVLADRALNRVVAQRLLGITGRDLG